MTIEQLVQVRIFQIDIIVCWIMFVLKIVAIAVAAIFFLFIAARVGLRIKRHKGGGRK